MPETGNPKWIALTRASIVVGLAAFFAALVASAYMAYQAHEQSESNADLIGVAEQTNEQILDCTEPGGECYQQQQTRTGDLLGLPEGPINTVVVTAIACADGAGVQSDVEIIRCVEDTLRKARR